MPGREGKGDRERERGFRSGDSGILSFGVKSTRERPGGGSKPEFSLKYVRSTRTRRRKSGKKTDQNLSRLLRGGRRETAIVHRCKPPC